MQINPMKKNFLAWQTLLLAFFLFALVAIASEKPVGSVDGRIALEQQGFGQMSYDIGHNKVYAIATGPRGDDSIERGVWVNPDGTFRIDQLPCGEYAVKIRANGYSTQYIEGVFIDQGKVQHLRSPIAMSILEPSAQIASNARVFTSKEKPHFWVESTGGISASVKIYKRRLLTFCRQPNPNKGDMEIFSDLTIYRPNKETYESFEKDTPAVTLDRKLNNNYEDWAHSDFKLDNPLDAGDYFAVAEVKAASGKSEKALFWFSVSDTGLIIKQAPDQYLVRAIDLNTLKAKPGVSIVAVQNSAPYTKLAMNDFQTGQDGFVTIPSSAIPGSVKSVILCGVDGSNLSYGGLSSARATSNSYQTYFYTERPIYRLGQTVYYKGISRSLTPNGFQTPPTGLPLSVVIEDPDNNKVWEGTLRTNNHGTFHGTFDVPEAGKTGSYQMTIKYPDDTTDYERFEVGQYRKPEYQVAVTPLEPRVVAGSKLKARIKATYYFGAPVTNARVKYSVYASSDWTTRYKLMPRPDYYDYFDDWDSDGDYGGDFITEGTAQTDESGEAIVEFDTKPVTLPKDSPWSSDYMDKRYKVEAEVTDLSRIAVVGSGTASVTAGNFALFVEPDNYVCKAGQPMSVNFTAVDYQGKPQANQKITMKLVRYLYDAVHYEYKGTQLEEEASATTGPDGKGTLTFKTKGEFPTDTYYITAQATDSQLHNIYDQTSIWIASPNSPYIVSGSGAQSQALSIKLDKPVYKSGDIAKVMITAPTDGKDSAEAIVAIESTKIHMYKTVVMNATAQMVEIPIDKTYAPNVYITATYVGKNHQYYSESEVIKVSPQDNFLNVSVSTDKPKYKPGETVTYKIEAKEADGKPAANCEFSLGVVDESIYAIRPETAENIQRFFWRRRDNWVSTLCTFPEQYSGGPDKIEPKVRKDFRDTAAWMPELVTDSQGIAVATVKLPDNLTTWRATVRGIDGTAGVGQAINKIISTQDLIVRLALPRFFSQGDQGLITAIVHNYTDNAEQISLTLAATPQFQIANKLFQKLSCEPNKAQRYSWPIKVIAPGKATISVKAIGQTAADAMELELPVRPLGYVTFAAKSGLITDEQATETIPLGLAGDSSPETAKCSLTLAASSIGPVVGNYNSLIDYPYGCTEQTTSRLVPSIVAMRLHDSLGLPLTQKDQDKFALVCKQALAKLKDYQHEDGGWGWWQSDASNPYLTSYVMEGLSLLKKAGYVTQLNEFIDGDQREKAKQWLLKSTETLWQQLKDPKYACIENSDRDGLLDLASMQYALSLYGTKVPNEIVTWELTKTHIQYPESLSYLTLAFSNLGDKKSAAVVYRGLVDLSQKNDRYIDWDHTDAMLSKLGFDPKKYGDYTYRFTGVETTALALRAVLSMNPSDASLIEPVKLWLLVQRGKDGWDTTKTTAQVLRALMEEEIYCRKSMNPAFTTTANLAGNQLASIVFNLSNIYAQETNIAVPVSQVKQNLDLIKQGVGRLYWSTLLTYWRKLNPGDHVNEKAMPNGLQLTRKFYRLKAVATTSDGKTHFETEEIHNGQVHAGETIMMKVYIESPISVPYVILDAALPSGGEVVSNDPRESNIEGQSDDTFGDFGSWWWSHQDVLDDRIVFFANNLPAGKSSFQTMIRMELPGTLQMNPVNLEGMYTKKVRAYSTLDVLKVSE